MLPNMRERTRWIGDFRTVFVTGGASRSKGILSVIGDIFAAEVRTLDVPDSAALGGALLAAKAKTCSLQTFIQTNTKGEKTCTTNCA